MDYKAQYRELVNELERLGGDLRGVPRYYSLEAEAKVRRLIKERSSQPTCTPESQSPPTSGEPSQGGEPPQKSGEPAKKADFIADYPVALPEPSAYGGRRQSMRDTAAAMAALRDDGQL